jgi:paraquat-inducible protein B
MKKRGEKSGSDTSKNVKSGGTKRVLATDDPAATPSQLRQPNERDQSADQQLSGTRKVIKQAHDDLQSGQQDTDARNRVAEVLPDVPKTPQNFDESDPVDTAPRSKKKTSG